ncbi:hypothetical protein GJ496_006259 [Pomphorhynchus laevis]|nr:hypothetical protein GJ496_006259 [Pomphorhynchus laevis]
MGAFDFSPKDSLANSEQAYFRHLTGQMLSARAQIIFRYNRDLIIRRVDPEIRFTLSHDTALKISERDAEVLGMVFKNGIIDERNNRQVI